MILDSLLCFSSAQTLNSTTVASTNIIDLGVGRDLGIGDDPALKLAIYVTTAFVLASSTPTLTIQAQGAPDSAGSPGSYITYAESRAYVAADMPLGAKLFPIDWPHRDPTALVAFPRFIRLNYTIAVSTFSAGALSAYLVIDRQDSSQYPAGLTITN
jgi:hypothetical protein